MDSEIIWGDEKVLKMDTGDGCINIVNVVINATSKWQTLLCVFHQNTKNLFKKQMAKGNYPVEYRGYVKRREKMVTVISTH